MSIICQEKNTDFCKMESGITRFLPAFICVDTKLEMPDVDTTGKIERVILSVDQEQPEVAPQVSHFRQVPLRTIVNWPHSPHISPS